MNISVDKNLFNKEINFRKEISKKQNITPARVDNYASTPVSLRSYINFTGNAPQITKATIVTTNEKDIPLTKTKNGGYIVEDQTKTELIYGNDATKFLNKTTVFEHDTQITFPKKATGELIIDDKKIQINENSTILLNKGTKANIVVQKGYPQIIMSQDDYPWYNKHSNKNTKRALKDKFKDLIYLNSHTYNGEFKPNLFSKNAKKNKELTTKLIESEEIFEQNDGYVKFQNYPTWDYKKGILTEKGFSEKELKLIEPIYKQVRQTKLDAKLALRSNRNGLSDKTIHKLEDNEILFKNKKDSERIYWKRNFESEKELRKLLKEKGIKGKEQNLVIKAWNTDNKIGYDLTGLKFINDDIAVYSLDDKINNWSQEKSCWLTNSTALSNKNDTPTIGTSIVQANRKKPTPMSKIRNGEHLHTHPGNKNKSQTEIYLITSGSAALTVVRNGKPQIKVLKEGELAIIPPNTPHCVNSVMGEYEQVVSQIPSAFQYGLIFKENMDLPKGYTEKQMEEMAKEELLK